MKEIVLYAHGGSKNHGCEAIVRSTVSNLKGFTGKPTLLSYSPKEDKEYRLDEIVDIVNAKNKPKKDFFFVLAYLKQKLMGDYMLMDSLYEKEVIDKLTEDTVAFFVGGDNYCYSNYKKYSYLNRFLRKKNRKTVLWCASVEPSLLKDKMLQEDLSNYDFLVARESITYSALTENSFDNVILIPDTAFLLEKSSRYDSDKFLSEKTVGINLSPLVLRLDETGGVLYKNYQLLVEYILEKTEYNILLVPHVTWENNNDTIPLNMLFDDHKNNERVKILEDQNCSDLKSAISKCYQFVGARTHSTIAAYSTKVPTLVAGYSVKSIGIARDLFGDDKNYVLPIQEIDNENDLVHAYQWLDDNTTMIKHTLDDIIPKYIASAKESIGKLTTELTNNEKVKI